MGSIYLDMMRSVLIGAAALMIAACGIVVPIPGSLHLYPIQGPLAAQKPPPVISASVWAAVAYNSISIEFPDGESFGGSASRISASDSVDHDLAADWDSVYGTGHYLAHVLGSTSHYRGVLHGSRGTMLILETNAERESAPEGVAKDSNGNTFKVTP